MCVLRWKSNERNTVTANISTGWGAGSWCWLVCFANNQKIRWKGGLEILMSGAGGLSLCGVFMSVVHLLGLGVGW